MKYEEIKQVRILAETSCAEMVRELGCIHGWSGEVKRKGGVVAGILVMRIGRRSNGEPRKLTVTEWKRIMNTVERWGESQVVTL